MQCVILFAPAQCVSHVGHANREAFESLIQTHLEDHGVQLVCLAGFMRILTPYFVSKWKDRLINIHPSILPSFKGKDAQKQALAAKVKITGCTVHFVEVWQCCLLRVNSFKRDLIDNVAVT